MTANLSSNIFAIYFFSILLLIAVSVFVLRVLVRRDYTQRGRLSVGTAIIQASIFFAFGGFPILYLPADWPTTDVPQFIRMVGWFSLAIGILVLSVGILRLGILRSFGLQAGTLMVADFYRKTRNPQALGCFLYVIGFLLLWPSWYAVGWGISLIAIIHLMVLTEEEHLQNAYGQLYHGYCKQVPRYLGGLMNSKDA